MMKRLSTYVSHHRSEISQKDMIVIISRLVLEYPKFFETVAGFTKSRRVFCTATWGMRCQSQAQKKEAFFCWFNQL